MSVKYACHKCKIETDIFMSRLLIEKNKKKPSKGPADIFYLCGTCTNILQDFIKETT
jgi:hypothetical protein